MESAREVVRNYDVHIDSKKRVTLRGAAYHYYNVKEYENGCIMLEPRELVAPTAIGGMTEDEVCEEVLKGLKSAERKTYTVDEVDDILNGRYGI